MIPKSLCLEVHPLMLSGMCALRSGRQVIWVGRLGQWPDDLVYSTILLSEEDLAALRQAIAAGDYRWRTHTYSPPESCETAPEQSSVSDTQGTERE